jgi:exosortase family protein XrtM
MAPSLNHRRAKIRFVVLFALIFLGGMALHRVTRAKTAPFLVDILDVKAAAALINLFTPSEGAVAKGDLIQGGATIEVAQGCDGFECFMLLGAALLAFPAKWRSKLVGLGMGIPLVYVCNLARIVVLYYVERHAPAHFQLVHVYVAQTALIVICCAFFLVWSEGRSQARATR